MEVVWQQQAAFLVFLRTISHEFCNTCTPIPILDTWLWRCHYILTFITSFKGDDSDADDGQGGRRGEVGGEWLVTLVGLCRECVARLFNNLLVIQVHSFVQNEQLA